MKVNTYKADGKTGTKKALPEGVFDGTVNEDALHQVVTALLANQRQGTASTKSRSTVHGGSRKPWRQKGTGRARAGSIRSALWRGGSVVFGPHPRSYRSGVPKKVRRLAIQSALNTRALDGDLALVEPMEFEVPKTGQMAGLLASIGRTSENVLFLTAGNNPNTYLSARNLQGVKVIPWGEASAYDVLWADLVLVEATAFDAPKAAARAVEAEVVVELEEPVVEEPAVESEAESEAEAEAEEATAEAEDTPADAAEAAVEEPAAEAEDDK